MHHRLPRSLVALLLAGLGSIACGDEPAPINRAPILTGPFVEPSEVNAGAQVMLSLEATDPDGDALTYEWLQAPATPAGTFNDPSLPSPVWTAPPVTAATSFQLAVTVSDGKEGTIRRAVTVLVRPASPANRLPALAAGTPRASPSSVTGSVPVQLTLSATDPDGDSLTYSWSQEPAAPVGSFSGRFVPSPTWTAPVVSSTTRFTLRVSVSDGRGGTVPGQVEVEVAPPGNQNTAPVLTAGPSASPATVNEQQPVSLSVSASDADGNPLTYSWSQTSPASPVGSFSNPSARTPSWTAPDVTASGSYTLRVTVSDGQGGSASGTVNITVQRVNQVPTVSAITGPGSLLAGSTGTFSVTASDPDGDSLTYSWSQTAPATPQGTWVGTTTGPSTQWYSPAVGAQSSFTLSVSVTDGQSAPVVRTLDVPVTVPRYSADIQSLWNGVPCTGCHGTSGSLSLAEPATTSHANLVNVPSTICGPLNRVTPFEPDNSALILKLEGTTCGGTRMPRNDQSYFDRDPGLMIRVRSWVLAGAAND